MNNEATIPGFSTEVDSTWQSLSGDLYYVESKFGTSTLTGPQTAATVLDNYYVERWGYDFFGRVGGYVGGTLFSVPFQQGASAAPSGTGCGCQ